MTANVSGPPVSSPGFRASPQDDNYVLLVANAISGFGGAARQSRKYGGLCGRAAEKPNKNTGLGYQQYGMLLK